MPTPILHFSISAPHCFCNTALTLPFYRVYLFLLMNKNNLLLSLALFGGPYLLAQEEIELKPGMVITQSVKVKPGVYYLEAPMGYDTAAIMVTHDSVTIDFNGAVLIGAPASVSPDQFRGNALLVRNAQHVTIKNAVIRGFRLGLQGLMSRYLTVSDCDLSYNYRQHLQSTPQQLSESDTLHYETNHDKQWRELGAGLYVYGCNNITIKGCTFTNGQNGLLMDMTNNGLVYNNQCSFNSGVGIGLYRSMNNRIMNNRADYNVRGFSKDQYRNGLGAAGILLYEQSNNNYVAYNSATHCSNGIIYWHGRYKFVFGGQGLKGTLFYGNDVSYAIHCGMQFGSVCKVINNKIEYCHIGLHVQNSEELVVTGNSIQFAEIACEIAGSVNLGMYFNRIEDCRKGLIFTDNPDKIANPGTVSDYYLINTNTKIIQNLFNRIGEPLRLAFTHQAAITGNQFHTFDRLLYLERDNDSLAFADNRIYSDSLSDGEAFRAENTLLPGQAHQPPYTGSAITAYAPEKPEGAMDTSLPQDQPVGESTIIMTEWGPYNFQYPMILSKKGGKSAEWDYLQIIGPAGKWKLSALTGWRNPSARSGVAPGALQVTADKEAAERSISLAFYGQGTTVFGEKISPEQPCKVEYRQ